MSWIAECSAAAPTIGTIGRRCHRKQESAVSQDAMRFVHRMNAIAQMLQRVGSSDDADLSVFERPSLVEVTLDVGVMPINRDVAIWTSDGSAKINAEQAIFLRPAHRKLFLIRFVGFPMRGFDIALPSSPCGIAQHPVDVEHLIDVNHSPVEIGSTEQFMIVADLKILVMTADGVIERCSPRSDVIGRIPYPAEMLRYRCRRDALLDL